LRDHLLNEIATIDGDEALALWAHRSLPAKNTFTTDDAQAVEAAYLARLAPVDHPEPNGSALAGHGNLAAASDSSAPLPLAKPLRRRNKAHLAFVASQPCLICKVTPCDAHHLKIAQPRSLGRKVSDEFSVPLCRAHHQELHRHGHEANWWANMRIMPMPIARELWEMSPAQGQPVSARPPDSRRSL
jgi:hypothetical protein